MILKRNIRTKDEYTQDEKLEQIFKKIESSAGLKLFDSQKDMAYWMCQGHLCEMRTGGGKTLAILATAARMSFDIPVVVLSSNIDLVERDSQSFSRIFPDISCGTKIEDGARVTFMDATSLAFSFLENMQGFNKMYLIIDEVDYVLIDSINTSYGIGLGALPKEFLDDMKIGYDLCNGLELIEMDDVLDVDSGFIADWFSVDGVMDKRRVLLSPEKESWILSQMQTHCEMQDVEWHRYLLDSILRGLYTFQQDVDYAIDDGAVKLIDKATGYRSDDSKLDYALQYAIERKSGVNISDYTTPFYSLTYPLIVRHFRDFCGCSGTLRECSDEMWETYGKQVKVIESEYAQRCKIDKALYSTYTDAVEYVDSVIRECAEQDSKVLVVVRNDQELEKLQSRLAYYTIGSWNSAETRKVDEIYRSNSVVLTNFVCSRGIDIDSGYNPVVIQLGCIEPRQQRQIIGRTGRQDKLGVIHIVYYLNDAELQGFRLKSKIPELNQVEEWCVLRSKFLEEERLSRNTPKYLEHLMFYFGQTVLDANSYAKSVEFPSTFCSYTEDVDSAWDLAGKPSKKEQMEKMHSFLDEYSNCLNDLRFWIDEIK